MSSVSRSAASGASRPAPKGHEEPSAVPHRSAVRQLALFLRSPEGQRTKAARRAEEEILKMAPHTVLVLVKATPEVIGARMVADTHPDPNTLARQKKSKPFGEPTRGVVLDKDVELVLARFEEEFEASLFKNKIVLNLVCERCILFPCNILCKGFVTFFGRFDNVSRPHQFGGNL